MALSLSPTSSSGISGIFTGGSDRVSNALRRPVEQLAQQAEGTRVRLSAFGLVQSATAAVQTAAEKLQDSRQLTSAQDAKKVLQEFVQAFNNERAALAKASTPAAPGQPLPAEAGRAAIASSQLERLLADNAPAFREAGIRVQQDGSVTVDAKALESAYATNPTAVTQAIGNVGRAAEATATRQLSNTGSVGAAVNNLSSRLQQIEYRENEARTRVESSQRAIESATRRYGFGAVGAGAYLGIFGL